MNSIDNNNEQQPNNHLNTSRCTTVDSNGSSSSSRDGSNSGSSWGDEEEEESSPFVNQNVQNTGNTDYYPDNSQTSPQIQHTAVNNNNNNRIDPNTTRSRSNSSHQSFAEHQNPYNNNNNFSIPTADQERQILLLMLLAQVCALHDPTPRTFTVHILELFERGILDRQSIRFLYDLGLVPSQHQSHSNNNQPLLLEDGSRSINKQNNTNGNAQNPYTLSNVSTPLLLEQRSMEASAIRSTLEEHHSNEGWSVEEHPLSLSRYQREFDQLGMLAAGSFGQVFRAINKLDGREYAVKRVPFESAGYSRDSVSTVIREVHCLAALNHPNVVRYYTSWLEPSWMTGSSSNTGSPKQLKVLADNIHQMITSGSNSSIDEVSTSNDSDNGISNYFFQQEPSLPKRRSSMGDHSFDYFDSSTWTDEYALNNEEYSEWTIDQQSKDDLFTDEHYSRKSRGRQNVPAKNQSRQPAYRYQICLFIQMQLCHPATLADWIRARNQKIGSSQTMIERLDAVAEIFDQIVSGLAHVHEKGIVHRDLKPLNIFASADGKQFLIGDFGLSKLIHAAASTDTQSSPTRKSGRLQRQQQLLLLEYVKEKKPHCSFHNSNDDENSSSSADSWQDPLTAGVGTASYASPEQVASRMYGTPADIYSLGLILLELLCCFSTEHERLQTFSDCRNRRELPPQFDEIPIIKETILSCTDPKQKKRPTTTDLLKLNLRVGIHSSHDVVEQDLVTASLKQQLAEKDQELDECRQEIARKDETIYALQQQIESMKSLSTTKSSIGTSLMERFDSVKDNNIEYSYEAPISDSSSEDEI